MQKVVALAALTASVSAYSLSIVNNCDQDAYIWSCGDTLGDMQTLKAGKTWNEDFYSKEGGSAGPSIYVSNGTSNTDGTKAQLEYFYQQAIDKVWWDASLINGNPFPQFTLGSDLEDVPYDACKAVECSGTTCNGIVYRTHEQLAGTHDCPPSNLIMKLCNGSGSGSGSTGGGNSAPSSTQAQPTSSSVYVAPPKATSSSKAAPSSQAAPSYTHAPVPQPQKEEKPTPSKVANAATGNQYVQENAEGKPVVHTAYATTIVTQVVTATAPAQTKYLAAGADGEVHGKREAHNHAHAHAHGGRARARRHQHNA